MVDDAPVLSTIALTKEFKGFVAVKGVNLTVRRGSIHALIGPNGAGKTTVFNLLTKFLQPTAGRILYEAQDISKAAPAAVARRGLVRSFQISAIFPHLSVLANVRVALQRHRATNFDFWRSDRILASLDRRAAELLEWVGLQDFRTMPAVSLSYGRKRALEIATTLALEPRCMLLDEPMAGLGQEDIERVTTLIRRVAAGRTVLMVEHNLSVVANLCDRITVMQRGEILAEGDYAAVAANPAVIAAYLGAAHAAA